MVLCFTVSQFSAAPIASAASDVEFQGNGWGHGLGMGQWGARGFAETGSTFSQILTHFYQGTTVTPHGAPDTVRVGIVWELGTISGSTTGGGGVSCSSGGGASLPAGSFAYSAISPGLGQLRRFDGGEVMRCGGALRLGYAPGSLFLADTTGSVREYRRGSLELSVRPGSSVSRAVMVLGPEGGTPAIDIYLYGVGEMPSSWPGEALKSQAVASRTYAVEKMARLGQNRTAPPCDCGILSSTGDQAYVGFDKESGSFGAIWKAAVDSTRWLAVLHNGAPIQAYFHSSSGGATEHNELQWGGSPLPYLRGVPDPQEGSGGNPHHSWTVRFSWADLQNRLNSSGSTSVGALQTVEIVQPLGFSGRVTVVRSPSAGGMRIAGSDGVKRVSGDTLRSVLGLKSNLFRMSPIIPPDSKTQPAGGYTLGTDGSLTPFGSASPASGNTSVADGQARAVDINGPSGRAGYVLEGQGGLRPFNGAPATGGGPYWAGWDIARDLALRPNGNSGYLLDGFGGVHSFGGAPAVAITEYRGANDSARKLVVRRDGLSGYVAFEDGGVFPFGGAPPVSWTALGGGRRAAGLVLRPDGGSGFVVDDVSTFYPFGSPGKPAVPNPRPAVGNVVGADTRRDGSSGYVSAGNGQVAPFGSAAPAGAGTGGAGRRDLALIREPSGYILDGYGGLHPVGGAPSVRDAPYWAGWEIAARVALRPDGAGYVMDAFGGLHSFGTEAVAEPAAPSGGPYWPGWTIARDMVLIPGLSGGGYVLDGFGGVHSFGGAPPARLSGYWHGWDIARRLAIAPNGQGGYVLDGWGGLHPFAIGNAAMPPGAPSAYWHGWDIARDVVITDEWRGYTFDAFGGTHGFGGASGNGSWYWGGQDMVAGASGEAPGRAWVVYADKWGGIHTAPGDAPGVATGAYWSGWQIVRDIGILPLE